MLEDRLKIAGLKNAVNADCLRSEIESIIRQKPDWGKFASEAISENVAPIIYYNLKKQDILDLLPEYVINSLKERFFISQRHNFVVEDVLSEILKDLTDKIEIIILKGALFSKTIYNNLGIREFTDVDLLIKEDALGYLEEVLIDKWRFQCNFRCPISRTYYADEKSKVSFSPFTIDVIWQIVPIDRFNFAIGWDTESVWKNSQQVNIYGQNIRTLCYEDTILYLVYHLAFHHKFSGLLWYMDILRILEQEKDKLDWDKIIYNARNYGISGVTRKILSFVKDELEVELPAAVLNRLKSNTSKSALRQLSKFSVLENEFSRFGFRSELFPPLIFDNIFRSAKVIYRLISPSMRWLKGTFGSGNRAKLWFLYIGWLKENFFPKNKSRIRKNGKLKVLHIVTRLGPGGVTEALLSLSKLFDRNKFELIFLAGLEEDLRFDKSKIAIGKGMNLSIIPSMKRSINPLLDLISLIRIYIFIRKIKPDIVHAHTSKAGVLGRIAAKFAGVPIIIYQPHGHVFKGMFSFWVTETFKFIEKSMALITDKIITLTEIGKSEHIEYKIATDNKFVVIPHGINLQRFSNEDLDIQKEKDKLGLNGAYPIIGTVAHLVERKGYDYFINAMAEIKKEFPEFKSIIVGDGPRKPYLEKQVDNFGLRRNTVFLGERNDVEKIYPVFDIFILSSVNEGMGRVLVEAMACARPVVATSVMGIKEIVKDGITGHLVPVHNSKAIADKAIQILKNKSDLIGIGQAAKERVLSLPCFQESEMVKATERLYLSLTINNILPI